MELSSEKQTILVLSDPHQEIDKLETILKKENYDIAVCLGDYFDSFSHNSEQDVIKTCKFLKKYLFEPRFFTTVGNHDISYLWDYTRHTQCSGYYRWKDQLITKEFGSFMPAIREKFLWYLFVDDRLLSHAGLHPSLLPPNQKLDKKSLSKWLNSQVKQAEISLASNGQHFLFCAGQGRDGSQTVGGLTWNCFDSEHSPIEGLAQIMGHTSHSNILSHHTEGSLDVNDWNDIDIDCHLNEYLTIKDGKLTIKKFIDL